MRLAIVKSEELASLAKFLLKNNPMILQPEFNLFFIHMPKICGCKEILWEKRIFRHCRRIFNFTVVEALPQIAIMKELVLRKHPDHIYSTYATITR